MSPRIETVKNPESVTLADHLTKRFYLFVCSFIPKEKQIDICSFGIFLLIYIAHNVSSTVLNSRDKKKIP